MDGHSSGRAARSGRRIGGNTDPHNDPQLRNRTKLQRRGRDSNPSTQGESDAFAGDRGRQPKTLRAKALDNQANPGQRIDSGSKFKGEFLTLSDAIERALADAIRQASSAGRWDMVSRLARELEIRRSTRLDGP